MADITLTFKDENIGEIRRAFCAAYGWRSQEKDGNRAAFMRKKLREYIQNTVNGVRQAEAEATPPVIVDIVGDDV